MSSLYHMIYPETASVATNNTELVSTTIATALVVWVLIYYLMTRWLKPLVYLMVSGFLAYRVVMGELPNQVGVWLQLAVDWAKQLITENLFLNR